MNVKISDFLETIAILANVIAFFWAIVLFVFTLMSTVRAFIGDYSLAAVTLYWLTTGICYATIVFDYDMKGLMLFISSAPVLTLVMGLLEDNRKRKFRQTQIH